MFTVLKYLLVLTLLGACLIVIARLSFALPANDRRAASTALPPSTENGLATAIAPMVAQHPDLTGIHPLASGIDAFAARMLLIAQARSSIDVQYYIWHRDLTGTVLLDALKAAAGRGVRVRLLLDDNGVVGLDPELAALDALPNMEVRLFNPFVLRRPKPLNYLFDFFRLNHRMHNKSFTVDNVATVIGGRNIGDEYFDTGQSSIFLDFDVMAVGKVVQEVSADFDRYWASELSYPVSGIVAQDGAEGLSALQQAVAKLVETPQFSEYRAAVESSRLVAGLLNHSLALEWTSVKLVSDDPGKALGNAKRRDLMITRLTELLEGPAETLDLVSAYLVPGRQGTDHFAALADGGVQVRILTNSFEATDVALVHSGYTKYRRKLLEHGVRLFELKAAAAPNRGREELGPLGSSGSSLHAKTFAIDGRHVFVGSFNFDPRSALLNTEMGLMIESPNLARMIAGLFDRGFPSISYDVTLDGGNRLSWTEKPLAGPPQTYTVEPGTSPFSRALITVAGWLPVEWML